MTNNTSLQYGITETRALGDFDGVVVFVMQPDAGVFDLILPLELLLTNSPSTLSVLQLLKASLPSPGICWSSRHLIPTHRACGYAVLDIGLAITLRLPIYRLSCSLNSSYYLQMQVGSFVFDQIFPNTTCQEDSLAMLMYLDGCAFIELLPALVKVTLAAAPLSSTQLAEPYVQKKSWLNQQHLLQWCTAIELQLQRRRQQQLQPAALVESLSKLATVEELVLISDGPGSKEPCDLVIAPGAFPKLRFMRMNSWPIYQPGAMPCLESVELSVHVCAFNDANFDYLDFYRLRCLRLLGKVHVAIICWGAKTEDAQEVEATLRRVVQHHPNYPTLVLKRFGRCANHKQLEDSHSSRSGSTQRDVDHKQICDRLDYSRVAPEIMSLEFLKKITKDFSKKRELGSGTFGTVYKTLPSNGFVQHNEEEFRKEYENLRRLDHPNIVQLLGYCYEMKGVQNGKKIAVKLLHPTQRDCEEEFTKEFENLRGPKHPNIVQLLGYCYEIKHEYVEYKGISVLADKIYRALCFEFMDNGSLQEHLDDESHGLDWQKRYKIIKGICEGLKYLHEGLVHPMYHLDLKPGNILLDKNMVPKLADFGLSKLVYDNQTQCTISFYGTIRYCPPEHIEHKYFSNKFDIFSLGVVMIEIIAGPKGYRKAAEMPSREFINHVQENWRKRLDATPDCASPIHECCQVKRCIEIALDCILHDRKQRPNIGDITSWLNETENNTDMLATTSTSRNERR